MTAAVSYAGGGHPTPGTASLRWFANLGIGIAVFSGGFVFVDAAPYDLFICLAIAVWALTGLLLPRTLLPMIVLLALYAAGGLASSMVSSDWTEGLIYVVVTGFLSVSAMFFAAAIVQEMGRFRIIFRAYTLAAAVTALLGIFGYFGVPGFEIFQRYSRAMGAFQDPNVFAPFLILPILYLVYGVMARSLTLMPIRAGLLAIILTGLLLSFSRAAWGISFLCIATLFVLLIINEPMARVRMKYLVVAAAGAIIVALALVLVLQIDAVWSLFGERVLRAQDHDTGRIGRFARHGLGFLLALERPFGIGPLQFDNAFGEDPHNTYLKALMAYGWLGFFAWTGLIFWTLASGFKLLFRPRPWQVYFQIAYIAFVGHVTIGWVIDTDHWRHFFLILGLVWGGIGLEAQWRHRKAAAA